MNEFVTQHAPDIALPPRGQWVTPEPQGGITPPENLYGTDGTPLNYIQDQGGPRQFFAPNATTPTVAPGAAPVAARTSATPTPIQGIRGMQEPQTSRFSISAAPTPTGVVEPQNLLRRVPTRTQPPAGSPRASAVEGRQGTMRREEPQGTSFPGILEEMGLNLPGSLGSTPAPRESNNEAIRNYSRSQGSGAVTLEDVLRSLNFDFSGLPGPRRRFDSPNQTPTNRGPSASVRIPDDVYLPTADPRADFGATGQVTRTSSRGPAQWDGRAEEIATALRNGVNGRRVRVTSVTRTGNARARGHPAGNSIDIDPADLETAREIISRQYPGMPVEYIPIRRGQDLGNGVRATGDHIHIDIGSVAN